MAFHNRSAWNMGDDDSRCAVSLEKDLKGFSAVCFSLSLSLSLSLSVSLSLSLSLSLTHTHTHLHVHL